MVNQHNHNQAGWGRKTSFLVTVRRGTLVVFVGRGTGGTMLHSSVVNANGPRRARLRESQMHLTAKGGGKRTSCLLFSWLQAYWRKLLGLYHDPDYLPPRTLKSVPRGQFGHLHPICPQSGLVRLWWPMPSWTTIMIQRWGYLSFQSMSVPMYLY